MRLRFSLALVALATLSHGQVWEKRLAPGLTYREEIDRAIPRMIHVLRWSTGSPVIGASAELGSGTIFDQTPNKGRETVTKIAARTGAMAAVNGDYFMNSNSGDPVGLMILAGQLVSVPIVKRSVIAWDKTEPTFGFPEWTGEVKLEGGRKLTVDGFNEAGGPDRLIVDTESAGFALGTAPDIAVIVKLDAGEWKPDGTREGQVQEIIRDLAARKLSKDRAAIIATGTKAKDLAGIEVGQALQISNHATGFNWGSVRNAVGGGPMLVQEGRVLVDWKEQRFKEALALKRHPRTAVGVCGDGDLVLVAVDGRDSGVSDGATLDELGRIMLQLGCREAMNLDGGGSTCMSLRGLVVNRPSDGRERPVANAITFREQLLPDEMMGKHPALQLSTPARLRVGDESPLDIQVDGFTAKNSEVFWSATGAAWIDQGGTLHAVRPGLCHVGAYCGGSVATVTLTVDPKTAPRTTRAPSAPRGRVRPSARPKQKPADTPDR